MIHNNFSRLRNICIRVTLVLHCKIDMRYSNFLRIMFSMQSNLNFENLDMNISVNVILGTKIHMPGLT